MGREGSTGNNKPSQKWNRVEVSKISTQENYKASIEIKKGANKMANTNIIPATSTEVYVPFGGADVVLGKEAETPTPEYPLLQYATGLPAQRPKLDSEGHQQIDEDTGEALMDNLYYAGFFTACDKDKELDAAMVKRGMPWIDIVHGGGEVVRHWMIERPMLFLVAMGIPSNGNSKGELGIAYQWRAKRNSTKSETVLYAQVVIRQLLPDYTKPFVFTVKSTQTIDALNAMRRQYKVLARAHDELRRAGRDMALPLWAYSIVFGASKKQEQRGQEGASKTIFPMLCGVPDEINGAYLQKHEVPLEYVDHLRECTLHAVEWAAALSERIASGVETQEPWKQQGNGDSADEHPL